MPSLDDLLDHLDQLQGPIDVELEGLVRPLMIDESDYRGIIRFGDGCYQRNLIRGNAYYQALFLCWRSGQRSPIHDHRGSACCVRVIRGIATETHYEFGPCGLVYPTRTQHYVPGAVCASYDEDMHQLGNIQPAGVDLVTLHIYSPPLIAMRTYFLGDAVLGECANSEAAALRARRKRSRGAVQTDHWRAPVWTGSLPIAGAVNRERNSE